MRFAKGCRPATRDPRDRPVGALIQTVETPPPYATAMDRRLARKLQWGARSCVGQATSQAIRLGYLNAGIECPDLSASYVYRAALNVDQALGDDGTAIRSALKAATEIGVAAESDRPYDETHILDPITFGQMRGGADRYGVRGYYRIWSVDDCKRAVAKRFAILGSTGVNAAFENWNGKAPLEPTVDPEDFHAICLVTYDGGTWDFLNSWDNWGINRGIDGMGQATDDFVESMTDKWAVDVRRIDGTV